MEDLTAEAGDVDYKQEGGDWGALGGAHRHRGKHSGGLLIKELAGYARQERPGPGHKIRVDPFGSKHTAEGGGVDVVAAPFYVKKKCGDLTSSHLEGLYLVGEGGYPI